MYIALHTSTTARHSVACTVSGIFEAWERVEMRLLEPEDLEAPYLLQSPEPLLELLYEATDVPTYEIICYR